MFGGDGQPGRGPADAHGLRKTAEVKAQSIVGLSDEDQLPGLVGADNNAAIEAGEEFRQVLAVYFFGTIFHVATSRKQRRRRALFMCV